MAFNVMDMITGALTPDNIGAVADALGMDKNLAAKGLGAAMPAVLAGVLGSASKPEGQARLGEALDAADPSLLDKLGGLLSGDGSASMIAEGSKLLSGFLGDNSLGKLAGALGSSLGAPKESTGSLLGLAAPMLMGLLAGKKKSDGLDVGGLVNSLMGQKELIASAIPDDVTKQLSGSGIFDDLLGGAAGAAAAVGAAANAVDQAVDSGARAAADTAEAVAESSSSWLKWAIIAAIVLGGLYFLLSGTPGEETGSAIGAGDLVVGGVDVGGLTKSLVGDLGDTLGAISDPASARAALPDLENIGQQLDVVERAAGSLPPAGRAALAQMVNGAMPAINQIANQLLGDSSIAQIIKPSIDSLMSRIAKLGA